MTLSIPTIWLFSDLYLMVFATSKPKTDFLNPVHYYSVFFCSSFRLIGMVVQADRHGGRSMLTCYCLLSMDA